MGSDYWPCSSKFGGVAGQSGWQIVEIVVG